MPRKYKTPRVYKSDETYQRFLEGVRKGANMPKNITPRGREEMRKGGKMTCEKRWGNKVLVVAENKEEYKV